MKGTLLTEYTRHLPADGCSARVRRRVSRAAARRLDDAAPFFFPFKRILCWGQNACCKGTRDGILKKVQPVSIHGQVSWDIFFTDVDDPDGQMHVARVGPGSGVGHNLEPGDRIQVEYVVGVAVKVTRLDRP